MKSTFLFWLGLYPLYIAPGCAALAGAFTWLFGRRQRLDDGVLLRDFLAFMALLLLGSYAIVSSDAVKERLDPSIGIRRELEAMPVPAALRKHLPARWEPVERGIGQALDAGATAPQLLAQLRPQYLPLARELLPFAPEPAVRAYAEALLPALQELRASDAPLCVQLAWPRAGGAPFDAGAKLGAATYRDYELAVAGLVASSTLSVAKAQEAPGGDPEPLSLQRLQAGYAAVRDAMEPRFGPVTGQLHTPAVAGLDPAVACTATIELLSRSMQQPPPLARGLLVNLLRS